MHLVGGVEARGNTLKIRAARSNDTLLAEAAHRGEVASIFAALRHAHVDRLNGGIAVEHGVLPVGTSSEAARVGVRNRLTSRRRHFILKGRVLGRVQNRNLAPRILNALVGRNTHVHLATGAFTALRGHNDDAVGAAGTVDRGRGGVLKYFNRFDVVRVEVVDSASDHNSVDDIKWVGTVNGRRSANAHDATRTRLTGVLSHLDSGGAALKGLLHAQEAHVLDVLGLDLRDGSRDVGLLLGTKTDYDDFVEL